MSILCVPLKSLSSQPQKGGGVTHSKVIALSEEIPTHIFSLKLFFRPLIWMKGPRQKEQVLMNTSSIMFYMEWAGCLMLTLVS